jgi:hypothetical protein
MYSGNDICKYRRYIAYFFLIGTITYVIVNDYKNIRNLDASYLVCDSCDLAVWRALEMKLENPNLFVNDRLFALQYPLFPTAFSRGMNILHQFTNNVERSYFIANILLSTLFIVGVFVLAQHISGNYIVTGIVVLLSVFTMRLSLYGDGWGLPLLKPMGIVAAITPWLMWLLSRAIDKSAYLFIFVVLSSLLVYVHPPTALCILGVGFSLYAVLLYGEKNHAKRIILAVAAAIGVLIPFFYRKAQTAFDSGPPNHILFNRAGYAVFPSMETITNAIYYLLIPMIVSMAIYPKVRMHLSNKNDKYLVGLFISGIAFTLLSCISYLWTGLAKFALPSTTRYLYFPIYIILALGIIHSKSFRIWPRIIYFLVFAIIAFQMDTHFFQIGKNFAYGMREKTVKDPNTYAELGTWAKTNTARDTVFLVPPNMIDTGFRILSERAVVVINKDGGNAKYSGTIAKEWFIRMQDVKAAYKEGKLSALEAVARKYAAQYVIVSRRQYSNLQKAVYMNSEWIVLSVDGIHDVS